MRIVGKRFFLLLVVSILSVNLIFCSKKEEKPVKKDVVQKVKEKKSRLKLENNVYLIDDSGLAYAYDTNLKKVVLLNKENNFRIIFIINE